MTAPRAAATMTLPVGAVHTAHALCDGSGLITFPTADGPERAACLGCSACSSRDVVTVSPTQRAARLAQVFAVAGDDGPF